MARNRVWTEEEENTVLECIKANPHNLKLAFHNAGLELNRSEKAIASHWYTILSKREGKVNTCFVTISRKSYGRNRKNCAEELPQKEAPSTWKRILKFFFG